jgi:hypothetical protein
MKRLKMRIREAFFQKGRKRQIYRKRLTIIGRTIRVKIILIEKIVFNGLIGKEYSPLPTKYRSR